MEFDEALLVIPINPSHFPAKLWSLVNNPKISSIRWDTHGEGLIIDQQLFEAELLSPGVNTPGASPDIFKTTNFTSFVRQLNLYGFRKVTLDTSTLEKLSDGDTATCGLQHHFHNPNFKQGHPELLVNLKRLTSSNKAKIEAGLEVSARPINHTQRFQRNSPKEHGSVLAGQPHQEKVNSACYQHHSSSSQQLKEYDRTPRPSRAWIMNHGSASSAPTLYTDKGVPLSVVHHIPIDSPYSPASIHAQQGSQRAAATGHKFGGFIHHHPQYRPGFYSPGCQCCTPGSLECSQQSTASYPHYGYYPNYAVGYLHPGSQNANWPTGESAETKKNDVNLDTVFKIVDELQSSPKVHMVRVTTPEKSTTTSSRAKSSSVGSSKPASSVASPQHGLPTPQASRPIPVEPSPVNTSFTSVSKGRILITVPGNVSSGIGITLGAPSSQSEAATD